jgi:NAD(P)-dependent dehydrogenase (short-subunit alcohol dehydrogenase family)
MAKVFITGSADGLGKLTARLLVGEGHDVVLHGRNKKRAEDAMTGVKGAAGVVIGDLSSIAETKVLAEQVNKLGNFDAIIHNAAVGDKESRKQITVDNLAHVFAINSLAPYILTCLINRPKRLVYMSSSLHRSGDDSLKDLNWEERKWNGFNAYSDSKLHNVILAFAVARMWPSVLSNALDPGWVPTKMGGPAAPDSLVEGCRTQAWLATSNDEQALITGGFFYHHHYRESHDSADLASVQEKYLKECERISGVKLKAEG